MVAAAPDPEELTETRRLVLEREQAIGLLNERMLTLQGEMAQVREALLTREAELSELRARLLFPRPSSGERDGSAAHLAAMAQRETSGVHATAPAQQPDAFELLPPTVALAAVVSESEPPPSLEELPPPSVALGASPYPVLQRVSVALHESISAPPPSRPDAVPPSRRREPRRSCALELEFTDETHFYAGLTQDLSQGGVFVATYKVFPVGSRLELGFQLPDGTEVRARGVVRWVRGDAAPGEERPGMGVAFTDLSADALAAIARYCRERAPLYMEL